MKHFNLHSLTCWIITLIVFSACTTSPRNEENIKTPDYPETAKVNVVDTFFGNTVIEDPYRWLEDETDDDVREWVEKQNDVTFPWLESLPGRDQIQEDLRGLFDYERISGTFKAGDYIFYYKNSGLEEQSPLYVREGLDGAEEMIIDPMELSEEGHISISSTQASESGKHLAVALSYAGSDWRVIRVMDMESRTFLDDKIEHVKYSSIAWKNDDGFYYSRYPDPEEKDDPSEPDLYHSIYFHNIGNEQSENEKVFHDEDRPERNFYASTPGNDGFVVVYASDPGERNRLAWFKHQDKDEFKPLIDSFFTRSSILGKQDGNFITYTDYEAPGNRLVTIDPEHPAPENWDELIAERDYPLQGATLAGNHLILRGIENVISKIKVFDLNGNEVTEIELPGEGSAGSFRGRMDDMLGFYTYRSFNQPTMVFFYDLEAYTSEVFFEPELNFDPEEYITKQVWYTSADNTEIPMFIVHRKDVEPDGNRPVYLYGYGGFNVSMRPGYSSSRMSFLENGGIYAMPNIRGGGEFGKEWHEAGKLLNKQNTFDDFVAAAEYLIDEGYTNKDRIAISGRSNGGLLAAAVMTQRPDLFAAVVPEVGVLDMLRYHKFTIGRAWKSDYGSPEDSVHFNNLLSYSPLHNLDDHTCYPSTLVITADHDNRVVPAHSYKFIARLQEVQNCDNPVLIRIDTKAGHGAGTPISQTINKEADKWAFIYQALNAERKNK